MRKNKFEYFLNAVHYCLYLGGKWSMKKVDNGVLRIVHYLSVLFSFESFYNKKVDERKKGTELWDYMYGKDWGVSISSAHHWFGYFYSGYPMFFSLVIAGYTIREWGDVNFLLKLSIFAIPIGLCYIPAYRAVFTNDRYIMYFKQFEKEDEHWHRKWKRISLAFCIGSCVIDILGISAAFAIAIMA